MCIHARISVQADNEGVLLRKAENKTRMDPMIFGVTIAS